MKTQDQKTNIRPYGLEDDYTAIEIDVWVPSGFEIADSKDEEKMYADYKNK